MRGVMIDAYVHQGRVACDVVNAVGDRLGHRDIRKVVGLYFDWLAAGLPLSTAVCVLADEFLFLRVDGNDWNAVREELSCTSVDPFELCIAIRMVHPFLDPRIALQAVPRLVEELAN